MSARSRLRRILVVVLGALLMEGNGIAVVAPTLAASTGQIYVLETNGILRVNDMTGAGLIALGTSGTGVKQFDNPEGIFVDGAGRVYVVDSGNNRVARVNDMTGAGWTTLGGQGAGGNRFNSPQGIFVDEASQIYVADFTRVVRVNDMKGTGWKALNTPGMSHAIFVR